MAQLFLCAAITMLCTRFITALRPAGRCSLAAHHRRSTYVTAHRDLSSGFDGDAGDGDRVKSPPISWYPGHIAKAERELSDYLKKVDVVIEVRDARIPLSTTHPMVPTWVGNRPLIVAIARIDQISAKALAAWREYYAMHPVHPGRPDVKVYFIDGKLGAGVLTLKKQALKAGIDINERRKRRGIQPRAVRAAVIGFPNVGAFCVLIRRFAHLSFSLPLTTPSPPFLPHSQASRH